MKPWWGNPNLFVIHEIPNDAWQLVDAQGQMVYSMWSESATGKDYMGCPNRIRWRVRMDDSDPGDE
jgi:hypothetical protein